MKPKYFEEKVKGMGLNKAELFRYEQINELIEVIQQLVDKVGALR